MSGAAVNVQFCAEAIVGSDIALPFQVQINRLEHDKEKLGYDVSSARGWMEHIEQCDGQLHGVGAYTVIRCDANYTEHELKWKIWGLEFHFSRLCSSYRMLVESLGSGFDGDTSGSCKKESKRRTDGLINALLDEATLSLREESILKDDRFIRTLMLTVLWTPSRTDADSKESEGTKPITIRGHATFSGAQRAQFCKEFSLPSPISACLAIPRYPTAESMLLLPRRHRNDDNDQVQPIQSVGASAKISSWCRTRIPLEDSTRFKVPQSGVEEVLLVGRTSDIDFDVEKDFIDSLEILEGLITNFFVIYKDGTVRTAPLPKVLSGYSRHLVLEIINELQELKLDDSNAPTVQDAKDGVWSEVFVTSAIKLIVPVNRILIPPINDVGSVTLWQSDYREPGDYPFTQLIWSGIVRE
ncbi:hypothetical protein ACHAXA_008659 [Cyclostephanos tholiformis]|uniref:Uncharacterized protein n=1 Tax=Cyclostephanos tholiformis TaxID=382380 RepID=A0ABD3RFG7_9STRA